MPGGKSRLRFVTAAFLAATASFGGPISAHAASGAKGTLTGVILGTGNVPLANVDITVWRQQPGNSGSATEVSTGSDGSFSADLAPGSYTYQAAPGVIDANPATAGPVNMAPLIGGHLLYLARWYHAGSESSCFGRCVTLYFGGVPNNFPKSRLLHVSAGRTTTADPLVLAVGGVIAGRLHRYRSAQKLPRALTANEDYRDGIEHADITVRPDGTLVESEVLVPGRYEVGNTDFVPVKKTAAKGVYRLGVAAEALIRVRAGQTTSVVVSGAPPTLVKPVIVRTKATGVTYGRLQARWSVAGVTSTCDWDHNQFSYAKLVWPTNNAGDGLPGARCGTTFPAPQIVPGDVEDINVNVDGYRIRPGSSPTSMRVTWENIYSIVTGPYPS